MEQLYAKENPVKLRHGARLIMCHLGGGCSVTAVRGGKSVDTSMGFTPVSGDMMTTRSGNIGPGLLEYLGKKLKKNNTQILDMLNKESGFLGLRLLSACTTRLQAFL